jgi:hypothetical protein
VGPVTTGPGTSQHSVPAPQHCEPQQNSLTGQATPLQGGVPHLPLSQYGFAPAQLMPHPPQLRMSSISSTHVPLQHVSPGPHGAGQVAPPDPDPEPPPEPELLDPMQQARQDDG